jgi:hypothetical protein
VRPASTPVGLTGRRRDSGEDKVEAIWRRAFDPDTLIPLDQYATSSTFEDPSDRRNAKEKYKWWGLYLAERREQRLFVPDIMDDRLDQYRSTMEST